MVAHARQQRNEQHAKYLTSQVSRKMGQGLSNLEMLLDYELNLASRYRRDVSLVLIADSNTMTLRLLNSIIRRSDEIFTLQSDAVILMGETEKLGALKAIERYKSACLGEFELRFAVVSFPKDGKAIGTLLNTALRRLDQARVGRSGEVICMG